MVFQCWCGFWAGVGGQVQSAFGMPKWVKFIIAVCLLPVCAGALRALGRVLWECGGATLTVVPFLAGAICWWVVYVLLPKPMWLYVVGHEMTHAVWTWAMGGRVKRCRAGATGGHVVVTRTNFLVALAPYFFPFYAALVVAGFVVGHLIWGWSRLMPWFHLVVGAAYAFHVTLTWHALKTRQSDITSQGYLFSAVIIFLGNVTVLLLGLPMMTEKVHLLDAVGWWGSATVEIVRRLVRLF